MFWKGNNVFFCDWLFWFFIVVELLILFRGLVLLKEVSSWVYTQGDSKFGRQAGSKRRKSIKKKAAVLINTATFFFNRFSAAFNPTCRPNFESSLVYMEKDLSIIIPLKGWDYTLPELVYRLINQKYNKKIEIILVVDRENPYLKELPAASNFVLLYSFPMQEGWRDKNWRLYQGSRAARYETLLFLDSDVVIDFDYLKYRLGSHKGDLSFSIPLYINPMNSSACFLSSFTNFFNFSIYKFGFSGCFGIGTAIGPSMLFTCGRDTVLHSLQIMKRELADDHALGYWFKKNGYRVECNREPVYVAFNKNQTWVNVCAQLIRWLSLLRIVTHLLDAKSILIMSACSAA